MKSIKVALGDKVLIYVNENCMLRFIETHHMPTMQFAGLHTNIVDPDLGKHILSSITV